MVGVLVNHFFPSAVLPRRAAATLALRPGLPYPLPFPPGIEPQGLETAASRSAYPPTPGAQLPITFT